MGLWGTETAWAAPARLPDPPADEIAPAGLESLAVRQRADLAAARLDVEAQARRWGSSSIPAI